MSFVELWQSELFTTIAIPILICLARMTDVTIGTLRIIFVARGMKVLAPILGFVEILIWITAIGQVMKNMDNFVNIFAYATGFSIGNFLGMYIEGKLSIGMVVVRVITRRQATELISLLRRHNYGVTVTKAEGATGPVSVIFTVIKRSNIKHIIPIITKHNPRAFYSIEDVRAVQEGVFPSQSPWLKSKFRSVMGPRKGK